MYKAIICLSIVAVILISPSGCTPLQYADSVNTPEEESVQHEVERLEAKHLERKPGWFNFLINKRLEFLNLSRNSSDVSFYHATLASFSVIVVSELGDKTWFIAAIMAMKHSRLTVFCGAMSALILMTLLSGILAGLGWATQIIPTKLTYYLSTALFALFGLKMLHEGYHMSPNEGQEEYNEAHAEVQKKELRLQSNLIGNMESGKPTVDSNSSYAVLSFVSLLFLEAFSLTFLAEWGDRSQLATIILSARENVYGVVLGGIAGHALCTSIAVIGGKLVATRISVRTVTIIGGVVFLLFAFSSIFIGI